MTEFEGSDKDFEDTFMATFKVSMSDLFGTIHTHNLKEDGDKMPVTKANCQVHSVIVYSVHSHTHTHTHTHGKFK